MSTTSLKRAMVIGVLAMLSACAAPRTTWRASYVVSIPPPPLPYYSQPPCPEPGELWLPGHWAWGAQGYYWEPGYWQAPPAPGLLWTPGYWRFDAYSNGYLWVSGHWGWTVGYYGGVRYGFGYEGRGFDGGYWDHDRFYYNIAVSHVGRRFNDDEVYRQRPRSRVRFGPERSPSPVAPREREPDQPWRNPLSEGHRWPLQYRPTPVPRHSPYPLTWAPMPKRDGIPGRLSAPQVPAPHGGRGRRPPRR